ncbi:MAG: hypothetical protein RBR35_07960 [Salinivirgaceae bacterium]|nr:hypothetical protein [Salinivirgaceae bacterium]
MRPDADGDDFLVVDGKFDGLTFRMWKAAGHCSFWTKGASSGNVDKVLTKVDASGIFQAYE